MAFVLWLLMALVPACLGKCVLHILYRNQPTQETSPADYWLTGGMIVIGLAEAAHLAGCILGRSFSGCVLLFGIALGVCLLASVVILLLEKKNQKKNPALQRKAEQDRVRKAFSSGESDKGQWIFVMFGIIVIVQLIALVTMQSVYLDGDMTLETVNSFLTTDAIYEVNPMTGKAYTLGMPLRLKILCLPTFYGILCKAFGMSAEQVVLGVIPAFVLLGSYLAYSTVAKKLFSENKSKRAIFMLAVALLYSVGDYMFGMDGFGVLHSGFRGVTIRAAILHPYTFGLMLRKKYKLVVLCILTEACIVWTLYGMGACVAVAAGMLLVQFAIQWYAKKQGGKEAGVCKNS